MILAGTIVAGIAALWLACATVLKSRHGISLRQAFFLAPLSLAYRVDAAALRDKRNEKSVIYAVSHQSRLEPALMLSLLPEDTLHILDEYSAKAIWLEPWRELARTIAFNATHLFVSRRLVRHLRGGGKLAVYFPPEVEPDQRTFRLYRAVARIALKADAKIVPIFVSGSRNSVLSLAAREDAPRHLFPRLAVHALEPRTITELMERAAPVPITASNALFDRVMQTRYEAAERSRTLFDALRSAGRLHGGTRIVLEDTLGASMSYRTMLTGVRALAKRFARIGGDGDAIGLLLPNAAPTAIAFFALGSAGRVAAMLNYTAGPANLAAAIRTGRIGTIVSSRGFVEKAQLSDEIAAVEAAGATILWLEDIRAEIGGMEKALAYLQRRRAVGRRDPDQAAVMLFTSGSEATPKGVLLSHGNLLANVAQIEARVEFSPADKLLNVLPVFHSFGLTGGMILPLVSGVPLYLYPSPLHYKAICETAARIRPTVLLGTDTFLAAYARVAKDDDFASLRLVVAGAEPVRGETRRVWRERFGTEILEGFGMTEAAPVIALNSATHSRDATVGRLLPAMRVRIESVEGIEDGGRLLVAGPNVMIGYADPADAPDATEGWHDTGDIVRFDREGFMTVRGRVKRFAKIAGEMVSLGAVEMLAHDLWPDAKHAAIAVPDDRKGERIVLLTTAGEADRNALRQAVRKAGAAEVVTPSDIVKVEEIPVLGTGKTDYARARQIALDSLGLDEAAA
ncbi:AMP-binding protein [Aquamicrobium sp. LC103]|uniref:AMP-binding protein n=1 Tax=Aquamicrobium sp. LC103 TaxID=1120658 RepID=UPI00063ED355|nr:AMP-binding protein [Aquamicrobium sp. LC103]TKT81334.1 2-acyl-glycerophospho-ethanolamine acyltransferase [Aquamicrobium sp. LC103]